MGITTKHRLNWIDYIKVLLIYLVVVAHTGLIPKSIDTIICSFHMPAFLIISGYLYRPADNIWRDLIKQFKRLIVPALFFSFVCAVYNAVWVLKDGCFSIEKNICKPLLGLIFYDYNIGYPVCGVIWFLVVLYISKFILNILCRYLNDIYICFICTILLVFLFTLETDGGNFAEFYYIERSIVALPFVFVGYLIRKYLVMEKLRTSVLFILMIPLLLLQIYNGKVGIHSFLFGRSVVLYYIIAILSSIWLFHFIRKINIPSNTVIEYISSNTVTILCLHKLLIAILKNIITDGFVLGLVVICFLLPVIWLFNKYIPVLIGNKK